MSTDFGQTLARNGSNLGGVRRSWAHVDQLRAVPTSSTPWAGGILFPTFRHAHDFSIRGKFENNGVVNNGGTEVQ